MHKAMIRRTPYGRRLVAVPDDVAAEMVARGEAIAVNPRLLEEVTAEPEADTYETKVMTPAKPDKRRKGSKP